MGDQNTEVEGLKSFITSDGKHVNKLGDGEYDIVETGLKLCKVSYLYYYGNC
jgi:hypothetical protein